ncbi:uncharacterized protein [Diadema setosum]|uniref:uncharacterized protein n=1 Tax=Diadema setosum TaxID=31175 RepID=UPI003B3AED76
MAVSWIKMEVEEDDDKNEAEHASQWKDFMEDINEPVAEECDTRLCSPSSIPRLEMEREVFVRTYKLPLCEDCGEAFARSEDFRQHLMTRHRHTQKSPTPPGDGDDRNVSNVHHSPTTSSVSDDRTFIVTQREQLHSHQADVEAISTGLVEYPTEVTLKVEPPSEPVEYPTEVILKVEPPFGQVEYPTEVTVKVEPLSPGDVQTQEAINLSNNFNNCVGPILGIAQQAQQAPSHEEGPQHEAYIGDAPFTQFQPQPPPDHHQKQQQSEQVLSGLTRQVEEYKEKTSEYLKTQKNLQRQLARAKREAREAQAELARMKQDARRKAMKEKAKGKRAEQKKETETEAMMLKLLSSLKQSLAVGKPKRRTRCITLKRHKTFVEAIKKIWTYAKYGDAVRKEAEDLVNKLSCGIQTPASKVSRHKQQKQQHTPADFRGMLQDAVPPDVYREYTREGVKEENFGSAAKVLVNHLDDSDEEAHPKSGNEDSDDTSENDGEEVRGPRKKDEHPNSSKSEGRSNPMERACVLCCKKTQDMSKHLEREHKLYGEERWKYICLSRERAIQRSSTTKRAPGTDCPLCFARNLSKLGDPLHRKHKTAASNTEVKHLDDSDEEARSKQGDEDLFEDSANHLDDSDEETRPKKGDEDLFEDSDDTAENDREEVLGPRKEDEHPNSSKSEGRSNRMERACVLCCKNTRDMSKHLEREHKLCGEERWKYMYLSRERAIQRSSTTTKRAPGKDCPLCFARNLSKLGDHLHIKHKTAANNTEGGNNNQFTF